jgi:hypothetical protein
LAPPILGFSVNGDSFKINCIDSKGDCIRLRYGFADDELSCNPRISYELDESIKIRGNEVACAIGYDMSGNFGEVVKVFGSSTSGRVEFDRNATTVENPIDEPETSQEDPEEEPVEEEPLSDPFSSDPFENIEDDSGNGLIIAAIVLMVATLGGGSTYYAYRKGYLDNQLQKFGILKEHSKINDAIKKDEVKLNKPMNNTENSIKTPIENTSNTKNKSSYDNHLNKLNKFIDDTISEGNELFDNFDGVDKGKVKDYDDTLLTKKAGKSVSKEEFDEFYGKSKNSSLSNNNRKSVEDEAADFEKFYKNKKISQDLEKKNSSSSKNSKKKDNKKKK